MKQLHKRVRWITLLLLVAGSLPLFPLQPATGPVLAILLSPFKLVAGALAPLAAVLAALAALLGLVSRSPLSVLAGGTAAALSARHVRRVTAPHDEFSRAFGPDWQERLARNPVPEQGAVFLRWRWTWHLSRPARPRMERDLPFWTLSVAGNSPEERHLLCDLWQPPAAITPSGLVYIFFHGGGWHQFDKDSLTRPFFRHLTAQGHAVMDVAYRLYPEAGLVDMIGDAKRAVAWAKTNAGLFGGDPERVIVAGDSAGGHLALMAAYSTGHRELTPADLDGVDTSVRGVVALCPVVDLEAYMAFNNYETVRLGPFELTSPQAVVPGVVGGTPDQVPARFALLSPLNHMQADCPPTLLLQAKQDHVVPLEPVRRLHKKLVKAGTPSIYVEYPGTEHVFDLALPQLSPAAQAAWYDVERFLALMI